MTMLNKHVFEYVNKTLQSIVDPKYRHLPFGGKIILISGDWKQLPPVVPGESRGAVVMATIRHHPLYSQFKQLKLTENMRVKGIDQKQSDWKKWLLKLGMGQNYADKDHLFVEIPEELCVDDMDALIEHCFPAVALADPFHRTTI